MRTSALLLGSLVLVFAGCGAEPSSAGKFDGEQARVAEAVEEIQTAGERRDAARLCRDLITRALREQVAAAGTSCDKEMEKALEDADAFDLEVQSVDVSGDTATAAVRGEAGDASETRTFRLAKESGRWRVTALAR